jgi:hypothetical protein
VLVYYGVDDTPVDALRGAYSVQHITKVLSVHRHADQGTPAQEGCLQLTQGSTAQYEATGLVVRFHDPPEEALGGLAEQIGIDEHDDLLCAAALAGVRYILRPTDVMNESGEYGPIPTDVHRQIQNKVHVAAKVVDGQWASVAYAHIQSPPAKARVLSAPTFGQPCTCEGILSTSLAPVDDRVRDALTVSPQEAVPLADVV